MDYIEQANSISEDEKTQAINIYIQCVQDIAHKEYSPDYDDYFIDMGSLFGERWLIESGHGTSTLSAAAYAKANVAFNFANLLLGIEGKFLVVVKFYLPKKLRAKRSKLHQIASSMNQLVTATTAEIWRQKSPYMR